MPEKSTSSSFSYLDWPVNNVLAFTTTRHHPDKGSGRGLAQGFGCFNLGDHVGDCHQQVEQNRTLLTEFLPPQTQVQWLQQVHGADVVEVDHYSKTPYIADAAITRKKGIALAVMTADCLPVLLASKNGTEIAAIHGGWRPLAANIISNTVKKMQTAPKSLYAWLGPCIGASAFEIGQEVWESFVRQDRIFAQAFTESDIKGKYLANLQLIAQLQLQQLGVVNVSVLPHCTFSMPEQYYSYRRESKTGRMATVITCL